MINLRLKPGAWVDPAAIFKQIEGAGYQARKDDVRLVVTGTLTKQGDRLLLTLSGVKPGPQTLLLAPAAEKDPVKQAAFVTAYRTLAGRAGQEIEIDGLWWPATGKQGTPLLLVRHVRPETARDGS